MEAKANKRTGVVSFKAGNKTRVSYVKVPTCQSVGVSEGAELGWRSFSKRVPPSYVESFCKLVGGTVETGIVNMIRSFNNVSREALDKGVNHIGVGGSSRLTAHDTLALKLECNLT